MRLDLINPWKFFQHHLLIYMDGSSGLSEDIMRLEQRLQERALFIHYEHPLNEQILRSQGITPYTETLTLIWGTHRDQGFRLLLRREKLDLRMKVPNFVHRVSTIQPLIDVDISLRVRAYPHLSRFLNGLAETSRVEANQTLMN